MTRSHWGLLTAISLLVLLSGCEDKSADAQSARPQADAGLPQDHPPLPDQHLSGEHPVKCGCEIEAVGHCGEYVEVKGHFVEIELPASSELGSMPFCGKANLSATLEGDVVGGKVVATSFELKK